MYVLVIFSVTFLREARGGQAGDGERVVELLVLVRSPARIDHRTETQGEQLLAESEGRLSPARLAATQARGRALQLDVTVAELVAEAQNSRSLYAARRMTIICSRSCAVDPSPQKH